jgi:hypothetical protein
MAKLCFNTQFMTVIRDVQPLFCEENLKMKINRPFLPHTAILQPVCATSQQKYS